MSVESSAPLIPPRDARGAGALQIVTTMTLSPDQVDEIAGKVADVLAARAPAGGDGWLRGAPAIAAYIDAPPSRVYKLSSAGRIPVEHDGSTLIARRSNLDAWLRAGGGKCP